MEERKGKIWTRSVAAAVFMLSLLTYFFTVEPTASYWDCPEYVAVGSLLEIGHPPGNPTWMLVARMASMLSPSPQYTALAVNLTSGLFTARITGGTCEPLHILPILRASESEVI